MIGVCMCNCVCTHLPDVLMHVIYCTLYSIVHIQLSCNFYTFILKTCVSEGKLVYTAKCSEGKLVQPRVSEGGIVQLSVSEGKQAQLSVSKGELVQPSVS